MSRLGKIVHKIANYVPWQSEGLTEDEFKVLDGAKGVELAEIAYNNRINFNRFLKNADKMIDMYNEQLIWSQIKEVRALKRCLLNPVPFSIQKEQAIAQKDKQVQRPQLNLVQNDDNVVPQMINEPEITVNAPEVSETRENEAAQTVPNIRTFVSALQADQSDFSRSIPMHRNAVRATDNITLHQLNQVSNIDNLLENDEMPILNEIEMAQLGIFDGIHGKKISKVLQQREETPSLHIESNIVPPNLLPIEENTNPPSIENLEPLLLEPIADEVNRVDQIDRQVKLLHIDEQPQNIIQPELAIIPENNSSNDNSNNNNVNANEIENGENTINTRDSMAERYESFRQAIDAANALLGKAKRRVKRVQRAPRQEQQTQQQESQREETTLSLLKLRKDVPNKAKRKNRPPPRVRLQMIDFDFFSDIEAFLTNDLPFEEPEEAVPELIMPEINVPRRKSDFNLEFDPIRAHRRMVTSTPMIPVQQKKRSNASPEPVQQVSKRSRLNTVDELLDYLNLMPDRSASASPAIDIPQELANLEEPVNIPQPESAQPSITVPQLPQPSVSIQQDSAHPSISVPQFPQESAQPSVSVPQIAQESVTIPPNLQESLPIVPELPEPEQSIEIAPVPIAESSRNQSIPQARRQSRLAALQSLHVTPDSIDYDRLRRNSKLRKTPIDSRVQLLPEEIFQNACENISEREEVRMRSSLGDGAERIHVRGDENIVSLPIIPVQPEEPVPRASRHDKFSELAKITMNEEIHIELHEGTKKMYYTEHQLSCLTLYLKIRFLMKDMKGNNPWRMTIKELFDHLKDSIDSKVVVYTRLLHMTQLKLIKAEWSDDDELLGIEIPLDIPEEASDKENLPSNHRVTRRRAALET